MTKYFVSNRKLPLFQKAIQGNCPRRLGNIMDTKDISTVSGKPENLIIWAKTASEVLDQYYGE